MNLSTDESIIDKNENGDPEDPSNDTDIFFLLDKFFIEDELFDLGTRTNGSDMETLIETNQFLAKNLVKLIIEYNQLTKKCLSFEETIKDLQKEIKSFTSKIEALEKARTREFDIPDFLIIEPES